VNSIQPPVTVFCREFDNGACVSTVVGLGDIVPFGVFETCVFFADGSSEVVSRSKDLEEAKKFFDYWISKVYPPLG